MTQLRVALAQTNPTVGDLRGNADLAVRHVREARKAGAHLVVFPEMFLSGYPVEDLALRRSFCNASRAELSRLAVRLKDEGLGEITVVMGYLDAIEGRWQKAGQPPTAPLNAGAFLHGGRVIVRYAKHHLPNYSVFDEMRYFVPGEDLAVARVHGVDCALMICEDLWQEQGPSVYARAAEVGLVVVINGSPYERLKDDLRFELCARRARQVGCPLLYVNMVGGQDELVFDGDSLVVDAKGGLVARAPQFREYLLVADLDLREATSDPTALTPSVDRVVISADPVPGYDPCTPPTAEPLDDLAEVYKALVLGTGDYARKNGFTSTVLNLSGGIDSALVATIAVDALGPENVHVLALPSQHSSEHSLADAEDLAKRQGVDYRVVPISGIYDAFVREVPLHGLAAENLQARIRGTLLMSLSNEEGHLALATGNKSELGTGYSTLYGDTAGGYAPLKDVPKSTVWALARWRNAEAERHGEQPPIPHNTIVKPPSAELAPGQQDSDSLPPYEQLDALLDDYIEDDFGADELVERGHDPAMIDQVTAMVDRTEYKRRQYPPGPKISERNFGRDRRQPITNAWREASTPR
ncbi:MAG: NAD+ synthase [Streptosporangiales bacterium]|nr:NAD+ synthase [Streptosporangiales bacterium]MBO0891489.1 NAD+ synthase [Acidothermales bacterium]